MSTSVYDIALKECLVSLFRFALSLMPSIPGNVGNGCIFDNQWNITKQLEASWPLTAEDKFIQH